MAKRNIDNNKNELNKITFESVDIYEHNFF